MNQATGTLRQTLEQRRANHAWEAIRQILQDYPPPSIKGKKYGGQAKKLPTRIMAAGLGQVLVL